MAGSTLSYLFDADTHPMIHDAKQMHKHMPTAWHELNIGLPGNHGFNNPVGVLRRDARPERGGQPGSDPKRFVDDCLAPSAGRGTVLLNQTTGLAAGVSGNPQFAADLSRAVNDYIEEHWLAADPRFVASICIAPQHPEAAVQEIRRLGDHPRFVQVLATSATQQALGHRSHWPIFEACCAHNLPFAVHPGNEGAGASRPFSVGEPESYFEWHTNLSTGYMLQITSLVTRGVFSKFPTFRFVATEGGFGWLPHLCWRLDKNWKALRATTPWLTEPPSHYVLNQVRLTTQPIEEPPNDDQLLQIFEMIHAGETLMYSSDYPHWDGDDPRYAFPKNLDPDTRERILWRNAAELYGIAVESPEPVA